MSIDDESTNDAPPPAPRADSTVESKKSRPPTDLANTGIAVGSTLLLGLTFAGSVGVGCILPDRGPSGMGQSDVRGCDAIPQRMDERLSGRDQQQREGMQQRPEGVERLIEHYLHGRENAYSTN